MSPGCTSTEAHELDAIHRERKMPRAGVPFNVLVQEAGCATGGRARGSMQRISPKDGGRAGATWIQPKWWFRGEVGK